MIEVENNKTPSGLVFEMANLPKKKNRPIDMLSKVEANTKLGLLKLKIVQCPDNFVTAIKALEIEYGSNFTEDNKVTAVASSVGPYYKDA